MTATTPIIDRTPIRSSAITSLGYSSEHQLLDAEFRPGSVYRYRNVPQETYVHFLLAESKGAFFNEEIRGRYEYERLAAP